MNYDPNIPAWATRATSMLWHYRLLFLIAVLLISAVATYSAIKVRVDNSLSSWFVEDSELLFDRASVGYPVRDLEGIGARGGRYFRPQFELWPVQDGFIDSASYSDSIR